MKVFVFGLLLMATASVAYAVNGYVKSTTPYLFSIRVTGQGADIDRGVSCEMSRIDLEYVAVDFCKAARSNFKKTLPMTPCDCTWHADSMTWNCTVQGAGICASKAIVIHRTFETHG